MSRIFLDLETTGVDRKTCRVVEIGAIFEDDDGNIVEYSQLINPEVSIPDKVVKIHGITNEHVAESPKFKDIAHDLFNLITKADDFIAYNFTFDFQVIQAEFERCGMQLSEKSFVFYDPMKIYKHYYPHKLGVAYQHYTGEVLENAHRALDDIKATKAIFDVQKIMHNDLREMDPRTDIIGKWFTKDENGNVIFKMGKHKDCLPEEVPYGYYKWMSDLDDLTDSEKEFIKKCMAKK